MRLKWDQIGERFYETGTDRGVLYPQKNGTYPKGVAWDGLISATESPSGAEDNALYADNIKYLNLKSAEDFGGSLECYYYPEEWKACNGEASPVAGVTFGQQKRNTFGFSFRTKLGNDTVGQDYGYKIHLWYGCSATPSERAYSSVNESPDAMQLGYEVSTTPVPVSVKDPEGNEYKPVACVIIDSTGVDKTKLAALEDVLYGKDGDESTATEPRLPLPDELLTLLGEAAG